jgi:hypothetical protein
MATTENEAFIGVLSLWGDIGGLLLGNLLKTKESALELRWRGTLRSVVRQGSALRSDRSRGAVAALTAASAAGVFLS